MELQFWRINRIWSRLFEMVLTFWVVAWKVQFLYFYFKAFSSTWYPFANGVLTVDLAPSTSEGEEKAFVDWQVVGWVGYLLVVSVPRGWDMTKTRFLEYFRRWWSAHVITTMKKSSVSWGEARTRWRRWDCSIEWERWRGRDDSRWRRWLLIFRCEERAWMIQCEMMTIDGAMKRSCRIYIFWSFI